MADIAIASFHPVFIYFNSLTYIKLFFELYRYYSSNMATLYIIKAKTY